MECNKYSLKILHVFVKGRSAYQTQNIAGDI